MAAASRPIGRVYSGLGDKKLTRLSLPVVNKGEKSRFPRALAPTSVDLTQWGLSPAFDPAKRVALVFPRVRAGVEPSSASRPDAVGTRQGRVAKQQGISVPVGARL